MTSSAPDFCSACHVALTPDARFCPKCGRALAGGSRPGAAVPRATDRLPWLIAGGALAVMLGLLLAMTVRNARTTGPGVETSAAVPGPAAAAPDIGALSPEERFDRLYNRVMQAAQSGDQATMSRFMPMALGAYEMLDSADADARYHAALLRVHSGDVAGSKALGDSILAAQPGHLFGYVVLGTVARWARDDAALAEANRGFLARYDGEMQEGRPEYGEHRASLEEFRRRAQAEGQAARSGP